MGKHLETAKHTALNQGMMLMLGNHPMRTDPAELRKFIEDCN